MKLFVWKNQDGYHLSRPPQPSTLVDVDFDPDQPCRQCDGRVLSISSDNSDICPWCDSGMNRPKMLPYQEDDMIRLLEKQSTENEEGGQQKKRPLIRNASTEKDLRDHLTENGYYGRSANILQLELKAIERPGWVQVFEFHVHAKQQDGDWKSLQGLCRTDERFNRFDVEFFGKTNRETVINNTTDGMVTGQRTARHWSYWPLMTLFAGAFAAAVVGAALSPDKPPEDATSVSEDN